MPRAPFNSLENSEPELASSSERRGSSLRHVNLGFTSALVIHNASSIDPHFSSLRKVIARYKCVFSPRDPSLPSSRARMKIYETGGDGPLPYLDLMTPQARALRENPDLEQIPPRTPRSSAWDKIQCQGSLDQESGPKNP